MFIVLSLISMFFVFIGFSLIIVSLFMIFSQEYTEDCNKLNSTHIRMIMRILRKK